VTARSTVLLDLDGTLLDSAAGIIGSVHAALRSLGHEPDPAIDLTWLVGPTMADVVGQVLAPYGETRAEEAIQAYRRHYGEEGWRSSTPYAGIPELLAALHGAGLRIILATAKRVYFAERMLEALGLARYFAAIHGSVDGGALDHKPELIAEIMAREGVAADDATMVGDRRYDITGAHANGMRAIGVLWGYGTREELEQAGADALAESPAALRRLLLG
jgi:phosphoglycolate phosphatase